MPLEYEFLFSQLAPPVRGGQLDHARQPRRQPFADDYGVGGVRHVENVSQKSAVIRV